MTRSAAFFASVTLFAGLAFTRSADATEGSTCKANKDCADTEFCDFPDEPAGTCDNAPGVCKARPTFCADVLVPVCTCEGNPFDNECLANAAGEDVASKERCPN
jgi:hypothetical protein